MVPAALRRIGTLGLIALWVLVSGGLLLLLALSVQNSVQFSQLQSWILLANVVALIGVGYLLTRKIIELVRAFRAQVPGSRLTARTVAIFGSLVIAPLIIVYLFSLEFLNRGIDSWFNVEIRRSLDDALVLSRSALEVRMKVSAGANVSGAAYNHEKPNAQPVVQAAEEANHPFTSPVNPALGMQSLTMNFRRAGRIEDGIDDDVEPLARAGRSEQQDRVLYRRPHLSTAGAAEQVPDVRWLGTVEGRPERPTASQ